MNTRQGRGRRRTRAVRAARAARLARQGPVANRPCGKLASGVTAAVPAATIDAPGAVVTASAAVEEVTPPAPVATPVEAPAGAPRGRPPAGAGGAGAVRAAVARRVAGVEGVDALLLRLGLAFVFVYAATASFADPDKFERYLPAMLAHPWVEHWCLPAFSTYELGLAVALATGRRLVLASTLAALTVTAITVVNPAEFDVLFRNVAIICTALSLAVRSCTPAPEPSTVIIIPD